MQVITNYLHSNVTPGEAGDLLWATIYVVLVVVAVALAVLSMEWLERKILAHIQIRYGPMRVGPHGLLQPIADGIKLLTKEDIIPSGADKLIFWLAPCTAVMTAFTAFLVVPFGRTHAVTNMNIGILFMLGVSMLSAVSIIMGGWASNSHYSLIGAMRSSAQMISYEVAMGLAIVSVILLTSLQTGTGTLSMIGIVEAQAAQGRWFIFSFFPLGFVAFMVFAIAMVAETNRAPFDLPEAESELVAGFHTEYSGFRWCLFFLAEYAGMLSVSSIAVTLWLGGWLRPFPNALSGKAWDLAFSFLPALTFFLLTGACLVGAARMPKLRSLKVQTVGLAVFGLVLGAVGLILLVPGIRERVQDMYWFTVKVSFFMYLYIWYRGTFPRYRFDQLMKLGWKVLLPVSLAVLLLTALAGIRQELATVLLGALR